MAAGVPAYLLEDVSLFITDEAGTVHKFSCDLEGGSEGENTSASGQSAQALCPPVGKFELGSTTTDEPTLVVNYFSSWDRDESLSWFLEKHRAEKNLPFQLVDRAGTKAAVMILSGTIESVPGGLWGGTAGQIVKATVTFKLVGRPVKTLIGALVLTGSVTDTAGGYLLPIGAPFIADLATLKTDTVVGDGGTAAPAADTPSGEFLWLADGTMTHYASDAWAVGAAA